MKEKTATKSSSLALEEKQKTWPGEMFCFPVTPRWCIPPWPRKKRRKKKLQQFI
jgi:hypothetical protein